MKIKKKKKRILKNIQKAGYYVTLKNNVAVAENCNEHFIMTKLIEKIYYITEVTPIETVVHAENDSDTDS